jgi:hypothetical protein
MEFAAISTLCAAKQPQKATFCFGGESQWMKAIFDEVK